MADNGMGIGILSTITGLASNIMANEWEKDASEEQYYRQRLLTGQNAGLALQNWNRTNFEAQRKHMEKAGLSVGLMYKQGGGQGVSVTPPGNISKRNVVPMDVQSGIQAALQAKQLQLQEKQLEANVANTNADTKLKEIEAGRKTEGGIEYKTQEATIENLKQQTQNKAIEKEILEFQRDITEVEKNVKQDTERELVYQVAMATKKLESEARTAWTKANVDQATQQTSIDQIRQNAKEQILRMLLMKITGEKTEVETAEGRSRIREIGKRIEKYVAEIENTDQKTANEKKEILLKEMATQFMYGDQAEVLRLLNSYTLFLRGL